MERATCLPYAYLIPSLLVSRRVSETGELITLDSVSRIDPQRRNQMSSLGGGHFFDSTLSVFFPKGTQDFSVHSRAVK